MRHLSEDELDELRAALNAEKDSLEEELAEHGKKVGDDWQGSAVGFEGEEADPTDRADAIEELSDKIPLVEELEKRYKEINAALKRMEDGTYGVAANGEPIDIERLQANPAATTNL